MAFDVATPVYEGPFDLLLHLILREQVDIYEVVAGRDRRRLPGRDRAPAGPRPRRRHRVPADRRDARRAEGPPAAAGPRRHRPRRRARAVGGARPAARPPARVQDVQGRRRRVQPPRRRGRPQLRPRRSAPTSASPTLVPDLLEGVTPEQPARRRPARHHAQAGAARSTCSTSRRSGPASPTPWPSCSTSCPASDGSRSAGSPAALVERLEVIVRFLAVLELFKQGLVELDQAEPFGDIEIAWRGGGVRRRRRRATRADRRCTKADVDELDRCMPMTKRQGRPDADTVRAIEAIVLVAAEPVPPDLLAQLLERPVAVIERWCVELAAALREPRPRLRAGQGRRRLPLPDPRRPRAVRRALPARRPARPDERLRRSRRSRSSPTSSRSPGPRSRRSAASTPTACCARLQARGYIDRGRPRSRSRAGDAVRHHAGVPREARPRLARRPAADRRVRAGRRRRRGARARAARRSDLPTQP